jgi:hypothetical protein
VPIMAMPSRNRPDATTTTTTTTTTLPGARNPRPWARSRPGAAERAGR